MFSVVEIVIMIVQFNAQIVPELASGSLFWVVSVSFFKKSTLLS